MRGRKWKWLALTMLGLAGLEIVYVLVGNVAIRTGLLVRLLSMKPDRFRVDGALYAELHGLSATVLFNGRERQWKLVNARRCYDAHVAGLDKPSPDP